MEDSSMDRFSKTCLSTIVLLLGVIALRPLFTPKPAHAAVQHQYLVSGWNTPKAVLSAEDEAAMQKFIDGISAKGWELVAAVPIAGSHNGIAVGEVYSSTYEVMLIFQR